MLNLKHELSKLDKARTARRREKRHRKATPNNGTMQMLPKAITRLLNSVEILNRHYLCGHKLIKSSRIF
jgi:hypothetical protein